jgi:putative transposase
MLIRKAFKFKLKTTPDIEQKCAMMAGCCRLIWNKALAMNLYRLENEYHLLWYNELAFWLKIWKGSEELAFLKRQPLSSLTANAEEYRQSIQGCF